MMLGLALYSQPMFGLGIILFGATTLFQLVTLPVEFDASARALGTIDGTGLLGPPPLPPPRWRRCTPAQRDRWRCPGDHSGPSAPRGRIGWAPPGREVG